MDTENVHNSEPIPKPNTTKPDTIHNSEPITGDQKSVETTNSNSQTNEVTTKPNIHFTINENGYKVYQIEPGLTKTVIIENVKGQAVSNHILGRVWINIKGQTKTGTVFEDQLFEEVDFVLGQAKHARGIEMAIATMRHSEHAIIHIDDPELSYSEQTRPKLCPTTKEDSNGDEDGDGDGDEDEWPLRFDLIVIDSMPKQKQSQDMTFKEQFSIADTLRSKGNSRYEKKRFKTALKLYHRSLQCLDAMQDLSMDMPDSHAEELEKINEKEIIRMKCRCYLNISICELRTKDYNKAVEFASKAIELDSATSKAYIRRGICFFHLGEYKLSRADIEKYSEMANGKKDARLCKKWLQKLDAAEKRANEKERKAFGGFLTKDNSKAKQLGSLYEDKELKTSVQKDCCSRIFESIYDALESCGNSVYELFCGKSQKFD